MLVDYDVLAEKVAGKMRESERSSQKRKSTTEISGQVERMHISSGASNEVTVVMQDNVACECSCSCCCCWIFDLVLTQVWL